MWMLVPLARSAAASQRPSDSSAPPTGAGVYWGGPASQASPNPIVFLVGPGTVQVGRAGTNIEVDIPIQGDTSVSGRHATLELKPRGDNAGDAAGATAAPAAAASSRMVVVLTGAPNRLSSFCCVSDDCEAFLS